MNTLTKDGGFAASRPPICILGVRFDNVSITEALRSIEEMIATRRPHYAVTANVDFVVQAQEDVELRRIFFDAHLVLCDGTPLLWASRVLGNRLQERVAGADIVPLLIEQAEKKQYRVFFLGAAPRSIERAVANVHARHPTLNICGFYSPPFNQLLEMDHEEIRKRVLAANPDLLFVSLGCPKQEKWVAMNYRALGVPVTIGVGATIDFLAGQVKRAPLWMQNAGLEWVFRLLQEPRRLYRRYSKDIRVFGCRILSQFWHLRRRAIPPRTALKPHVADVDKCVLRPKILDAESVKDIAPQFEELVGRDEECYMDLSRVQSIDSTGIAALMKLRRQIASSGRHLIFIGASQPIMRALKFMRLGSFFDSAQTVEEAREIVRTREQERLRRVALETGGAFRALVWYGEITAANADDVWERTRNHMQQATLVVSGAIEPLVIDMSVVRFIDSSGLGLMVRARKFARQSGLILRFTNLQPPVLNVIQIARLEEFLLDQKRTRFPMIQSLKVPAPQAPGTKRPEAAEAVKCRP